MVTDRAVLARTLVGATDAEIVRRTFLRTVPSGPAGRTLAPSVVRVARRSVLALTRFGAELAELAGRTRFVAVRPAVVLVAFAHVRRRASAVFARPLTHWHAVRSVGRDDEPLAAFLNGSLFLQRLLRNNVSHYNSVFGTF